MSKPNRKRLKLETVRAQRLEATGDKFVEVIFEDTDGDEQTVRFLRQSWWPLALMRELTNVAPQTPEEEAEPLSALDRSLSVLRKAAHDKPMFDKLSEQLTIGDFNAVMELINSDDEDGVSQGESSSSSE
jgi:hypothetical protein